MLPRNGQRAHRHMLIGSETERVRAKNNGGKLLLQQWIKKSDTGNLV